MMKTSRQPRSKPSFQASCDGVLPEPCTSDHVNSGPHRSPAKSVRIPAKNTADPLDVDSFGKGGKRVNIRVIIPVPTRTLFAGTVERKVTPVQNVGSALEEANSEEAKENRRAVQANSELSELCIV